MEADTSVKQAQPPVGARPISGLHADRRTKAGRRFKQLSERFAAEVSALRKIGERDRVLIGNAAAIALQCEFLQTRVIRGEANPNEVVRLSNTLSRVLVALGISDQPHDTQSLPEYLRSIGAAA